MAEKQGITWGGAIKGIARTAGYLTVGIAIAVAASQVAIWAGLASSATAIAAGTTAGASMAGIPNAILDNVQSGTEWVAAALNNAFGGVTDLFTSEAANVSNEALIDQITVDVDPAPTVIIDNDVAAINPEVAQVATIDGDFKLALGESTKNVLGNVTLNGVEANPLVHAQAAFSEMEAELEAIGLGRQTGIELGKFADMQSAAEGLANANSDAAVKDFGNQFIQAWNTVDGGGNGFRFDAVLNNIDARIAALPSSEEAGIKALEGLRDKVTGFVGQMEALQDSALEIAQTANHGLGGDHIELPNANRNWMIAGGAILGAKAAHRLGERKGQKEAIGAFTQAELDRRGAAARFAGMQNQLG